MVLEAVDRFIARHVLLEAGAAVLVGVSGGVDSVVLLHVLRRLGYRVQAAHVNYHLRGAASDGDEAFVRALCEEWDVHLHVTACDAATQAERGGQSIQEAARALRYGVFRRVAEAEGLAYVAVAHQRDDQAETVLLHLFRGTGPEGLAGMPPARPLAPGSPVRLVRPLLDVRRREVVAYARAEGLRWREDTSNRSLAYQRNAIRHQLFPQIEEHVGPAALDNVARSAALMRAYVEADFRETLAAHVERAARTMPEGGVLDGAYLDTLAPVWRRRVVLEALKRWLPEAPRSAAVAEEIDTLLASQPGRRVEVKGGTVWRERDGLFFVQADPKPADREATLTPDAPVTFGGGVFSVDVVDAAPEDLAAGAPTTVYADADRLRFPLTVRRWQAGDRFQPLGMTGTKTVSNFLTDEKVPSHRRHAVPVVVSGDEIVWVAGHRLAHGVRVRSTTQRYAKISYNPAPDAD